MKFSSRFKIIIPFSLILMFVMSLVLLGSVRVTVHATGGSLRHATEQGGVSITPASTCGAWSVIPSPNVVPNTNQLYGVIAISANSIWAVGYYRSSSGPDQTLIEHWDGTSWSIIPSPNVRSESNYLQGVAAISGKNIWAVGYYTTNSYQNTQTLIEHWDGTSWGVVSSPSPGSYYNHLDGVARVPGTNQVWAVGNYSNTGTSSQTLIEQWNGTNWSVVSSPSPGGNYNDLNGVTAISASNVWTVGDFVSGTITQTLTEQWNGTNWSVVSSPSPGNNNTLNGVARVPGTSQVWAVGYYGTPTSQGWQTLIEQWNGTSWNIASSPNAGSSDILSGVAIISASNIWVVGTVVDNQGSVQMTLIEHWNGTNWHVISSPNPGSQFNWLYGVTRVPSTNQVWAVGTYNNSNNPYQTLTEFHC